MYLQTPPKLFTRKMAKRLLRINAERVDRPPVEKQVLAHGGMKYACRSCGKSWFMCLEVGVEDFGKHGRPHQPCPFMTPCDCGGFAEDISGYLSFGDDETRPLFPGMRYFAYDHSGKDDACGIATRMPGGDPYD